MPIFLLIFFVLTCSISLQMKTMSLLSYFCKMCSVRAIFWQPTPPLPPTHSPQAARTAFRKCHLDPAQTPNSALGVLILRSSVPPGGPIEPPWCSLRGVHGTGAMTHGEPQERPLKENNGAASLPETLPQDSPHFLPFPKCFMLFQAPSATPMLFLLFPNTLPSLCTGELPTCPAVDSHLLGKADPTPSGWLTPPSVPRCPHLSL